MNAAAGKPATMTEQDTDNLRKAVAREQAAPLWKYAIASFVIAIFLRFYPSIIDSLGTLLDPGTGHSFPLDPGPVQIGVAAVAFLGALGCLFLSWTTYMQYRNATVVD